MALVQFSGLASGIDSSALIEALISKQRATRIDPLQNKISELEDANSALGELSTLLGNLRDAGNKFRVISGGAISKTSTSSDESILTSVANNSAQKGTHQINVTQLAQTGSLSFDDRFSSGTSAIYSGLNDLAPAADRTVTVDVGTGTYQESISVELTSTSTLNDFVSDFNAQATKATASIVNTGTSGSPSYALLITSNETGTDQGSIGVSVGTAIQDAGSGAFNANTLNQAKDANFTIAGISGTITRSSNTISDAIQGVSFSLQSTGSASISVGVDLDQTTASVQEFVDAYNEVVQFISDNNQITIESTNQGNNNIFASLAKQKVDDNSLSAIRSVLASTSTNGTAVNILADLGITTNRDGTLAFDNSVFGDALNSETNNVESLLESLGENLSATGGTIDQFTRFNGLFDSTINSNTNLVTSYQKSISDTEKRLGDQEEKLNARYARLEALIGKLQSQQSSLTSLLSGIGG